MEAASGQIAARHLVDFSFDGNEARMSRADVALLKTMLRLKKPKKVLELGVFRGCGTVHILEELPRDAELFSVDLNTKLAGHTIGEVASRIYNPQKHAHWTPYFGKDISQCIENIGHDIDFVFLDTSHMVPGEILSYICILSFLRDSAIVLMHDIAFHTIHNRCESYSNIPLFNAINLQYKCRSLHRYSNMSAAILEKENELKAIDNIVNILCTPWKYNSGMLILESSAAIIRKHYDDDIYPLFSHASASNFSASDDKVASGNQIAITSKYIIIRHDENKDTSNEFFAPQMFFNLNSATDFACSARKVSNSYASGAIPKYTKARRSAQLSAYSLPKSNSPYGLAHSSASEEALGIKPIHLIFYPYDSSFADCTVGEFEKRILLLELCFLQQGDTSLVHELASLDYFGRCAKPCITCCKSNRNEYWVLLSSKPKIVKSTPLERAKSSAPHRRK